MLSQNDRHRTGRTNVGGVTLEAAIVLPVLFLLIGLFVDASVALLQHSLSSFAVTKLARDLSIQTDCSTGFDEYSAKKTLEAALASFHVRANIDSMEAQLESVEASDVGSGAIDSVTVGRAVRIRYEAHPTCLMCFFTSNLFTIHHSALFLLEDSHSSDCG